MTGKYDIEVYTNRIHYKLTVRRNITILQGDSATGKSELIRMIGDFNSRKESSGITLKCEKKCTVLTEEDWEERLGSFSNRIVFIDEGNYFLRTKEFARCLHGSDNYFVIVTRDDLYELPYSISEIYGFREDRDSQKYRNPKPVYNEMYQLYELQLTHSFSPCKVLVEDSNSGYEFFQAAFSCDCCSLHGKGNVKSGLLKERNAVQPVLTIVDGAAFGPEMRSCMEIIRSANENLVLYAPESFEYLLLSAKIVDVPDDIIYETYLFADSKQYMSWEEYYTSILTELTKNTPFAYTKRKLNPAWINEASLDKVTAIMPDQLILRNDSVS